MADININELKLSDWVLVNKESGESIEAEILGKSSSGFSKAFNDVLYEHAKKMDRHPILALWSWILTHKDRQNCVICRKAEISKDINTSTANVTKLIKCLKDNDLIRNYSRGVYMINPSITYTGGFAKQVLLKDVWKGLG